MSKSVMKVAITEHDRLYVQFVMGMTNEHFDKYSRLPYERRSYLFLLWVKKNFPDKVEDV